MSVKNKSEPEYEDRLRELLVEVATTYINLPLDMVDRAIRNSLAKMGEVVSADRAYLFHYDFEAQLYTNTHEWCREGIEAQIENLQCIPTSTVPQWVEMHQAGEVILISDTEELTWEGIREVLLEQDIKSLVTVPLMDRDNCLGFVGFDSVFEHRKYSERELDLLKLFAQMMVNLELRRREGREKEALQDQLLHAQKMESLGRLAGGIAHDFNNMLGVIIGHGELAIEMVSPEDPVYYDVEKIVRVAHRSADLTRQLLAFARRQAASPRVLDLNDTVEAMTRMLRRLIGEQIELVWQPLPQLYRVRIDPGQVEQILANLVVNARDAIASGGTIWLRTENVKISGESARRLGIESGDYARLRVEDDGCGLGPEVLPHLFEPFFTTKEFSLGAGLGLSTAYGIVKQNDGGIEGHNRPGSGACFDVYLPRDFGVLEERSSEWVLEGRPREVLLLVEDERELLELTGRMLEGLGYQVFLANSPREAIHLWEEQGLEDRGIDLLITDVVMPEMTGKELAARLLLGAPDLKVLYMSGYGNSSGDEEDTFKDYFPLLRKPFARSELALQIREVIEEG